MISNSIKGKKPYAAFWGFAEATLFFILPDVLLSYLALDKKEPLLKYCLWTLLGALLGGAILYWLAAFDQNAWWQIIESVPAIDSNLMNQVSDWMQKDGLLAILLGPSQGLPYKVFAVQAHEVGIGFWLFLLISIPARLLRFLLIAYLARLLSMTILSKCLRRIKIAVWALIWIAGYVVYFSMFPS